MEFIAPKELSSNIKVIGVGNGGINAVNNMCREGINGIDLIVCDTDAVSLAKSPVKTKIQLGEGMGTGGKPVLAKQFATENAETIKNVFVENTRMLFIMAGMGGGTGTGAAPVIAKIVKEIDTKDEFVPNILVVAVVTLPFHFEGRERLALAQHGLDELRSVADALIVIDNNKMIEGEHIKFSQCFAKSDEMMFSPIKNLTSTLTCDALINCDLRDIDISLRNGGDTFMGVGVAKGETRSLDAMLQALQKPLTVISDVSGARAVFLHFSFSKEHELTNDELGQAFDYFNGVCVRQPIVRYGVGYDETLGESLKIIVVATDIQPTERDSDERLLGEPSPIY